MHGVEYNSRAAWSWMWKLILRVLLAWLFEWKVFAAEPSFRVPPDNVTVIEGDTAILKCSILHLTEKHKIIWTDSDGFVLTLNEKRIYDDQRFSVERPHKNYWNLYIRNVRYSDRGKYICQIDTTPVKLKEVMLDVEVPAHINDRYSSNATTVLEGESVHLVCNASGVPPPEVTWYRISNYVTANRERIGTTPGEGLKIHNVTRDCGGTYVCVAENEVGDSAERFISVTVDYAPEVYLQTSRLGQYPGKETFLLCDVTAHPHGLMFWEKDGNDLSKDKSGKYQLEISNSDYDHKKTLSLRIREINADDFGRYVCRARNFIGNDRESMLLYDYSKHVPPRTTTRKPVPVVTTPRPIEYNTRSPWTGKAENVGAIRGRSRNVATKCTLHVTSIIVTFITTILFITRVSYPVSS